MHAAQGRGFHSKQNILSRNEIGRGHDHITLGTGDHREVLLLDVGKGIVRPSGNDLGVGVALGADPGKEVALSDQVFAAHKIPVRQEHKLQTAHRRPFQPQMGIPPVAQFRITVNVLIGNIDTTGKADLAVHYYDLPVVAIIDLIEKPPDTHRNKRMNIDPAGADLLQELTTEKPAAKTIEDHPYHHAFFLFLGE